MIVYKCKMCGGNLNIQEGDKITTCEYCQTQQTIPSTDDEKRANLFNRANHFRRNGEFDKAMGIYEHILEEDSSDAELYWLILLCKYGVAYVEDSISKAQKPTLNRTQAQSILKDADYLMALEHADYAQRKLYEKEAKELEQIQKEILLIAQNETPYDIFISYKERTKRGGERTKASVLAQDIYNHLTKEGYRVFFSRVSLEKIVGQKYEPYIYSALHSAKVMLVIGTEKDEFTSPWVRNEWSRFLAVMREDTSKLLIPCFRDLEVDDLPDEFQILQSQDMSKLGFEQDLLRGISKVIYKKSEKSKEVMQGIGTVQSLERLIQNGETYMRLQNYEVAYGVYEDITKLYPEDYRGWWGLMQSSTKNFVVDYIEDVKQDELNRWFEYMRQLASKEIYKEKSNQYIEFLKSVSVLQALGEIKTVTEKIKEYRSEIDGYNMEMSNIVARESNQREEHQKENQTLKLRLETYNAQYSYIEEKRAHEIRIKVIFVVVMWCFVVFAWIISSFLGIALGILGTVITIALCCMDNGSGVDKELAQINKFIFECKKALENSETKFKGEIRRLSDRKIPCYDLIEKCTQRIFECNKYVEYGLEEIAQLHFALNCEKIGITEKYDWNLFSLRDKILGFFNEEPATETKYLEIYCNICGSLNRVSTIEIKSNENTFKCITCGSIIRV